MENGGADKATIDIALPYYGDVALMQAAVSSVRAQTDPRWRLYVVDDGKEPGVPEWFAGLDDPRISYERNEVNLGITANYLKCLAMAEAERVTILGCDDVLLPEYVATIHRLHAQHPGADMIQPGVEIIDGDGTSVDPFVDRMKRRMFAPELRGTRVMGGEELATTLLRGNWTYFPSISWRTEAIRAAGFDARFVVTQDLDAMVRLIASGGEMVVDDTVVFQYRRHASSASSTQAVSGKRFAEERAFFESAAARMTELGWEKAAKAARRHVSSRVYALTMVPAAVKHGDTTGVRTLARHVLG
ncbi:glycosyltransferase involved in cell wall biosynthesis [Catenulispora sp. GAS73]|uniref:glycosyltransferase family 2 protein n=1 Tax=Catenulispora sp. GAS73 TaxID=3156269 RepID=UPI00351942CB